MPYGAFFLDNKNGRQNGETYEKEALKGLKMGFDSKETY
jgi:hypothetical protein